MGPSQVTLNDNTEEETVASNTTSVSQEMKLLAIKKAIDKADKSALAKLATSSGGLLDNSLRRDAWPLLLGANPTVTEPDGQGESWRDLPAHSDEEQVQKDVDRAFIFYPKNQSAKAIAAKKADLSDLITRVLRTHSSLCYFQGYHDIAAVLLLVLEEQAAYSALANLSLFRIRDYMLPNIRPAEKHLVLIPAILKLADHPLAHHISQIPVFYALAGTLTLYAHDIPDFEDITRLYDFLLAHEPVMAIYLFASIIIQRRELILSIPADDPDMMHYTLTKLPQHMDLESLIAGASELYHLYPPENLPGRVWSSIPASSVLKTSRDNLRQQTVSEAEQAIQKQKHLLAWEATKYKMWKYMVRNRRPLVSVSTAVLAIALSVWLRRNGHDTALVATIRQFSRHSWPS